MLNDSSSFIAGSLFFLDALAMTWAALTALRRITPSSAALSRTARAPSTPLRKSMSMSLSTTRSFVEPLRSGYAFPAAGLQAPK